MRGAAAVPAVTLGVSSGYCLIVQLSDNSTKGRSMPLEIVPKTPLSPDVPALQAWLAPHWPAAASGLRLSRLAGGQSNPTWLLTPAQGEPRVLRAKPGPQAALLPSAHAIEREFAVLQALQGSEVPVPRVHRFCADESVIGAAFYLMAYVPGRVLRDASLPGMSPAERTALHDEAHRVLAALHRVDWRARGLQDFGRTEAYFERLIARWTRQYRASHGAPDRVAARPQPGLGPRPGGAGAAARRLPPRKHGVPPQRAAGAGGAGLGAGHPGPPLERPGLPRHGLAPPPGPVAGPGRSGSGSAGHPDRAGLCGALPGSHGPR